MGGAGHDIANAIGIFVVSSGFGGLMAVVAALIAYWGILRRIRADQEIAQRDRDAEVDKAVTTDQLERWWDVCLWLWENRDDLDVDQRRMVIQSLRDSMVHRPHGAILEAVTLRLLPPEGNDDEAQPPRDDEAR